ncbi:MAG: hypothetical protein GTO45_01435 [Candidatus Aminicenantes bacterium]|nr:hypothetical protein [Candidatus Aminicenantes bacterium]NIM77423.1 hypothetical protein [Candidatus Aminicenantes bacterium]NIN16729.1 hypothetical protein [Candidatus Aminicenantes bacterium]NIN40585.1 hypothetical protein [Candidatus Aminicenantes bacterium]NIN83406.1 hypothetical protein [Candidatus Aminicenantes bacterium]
MNIKRAFNWKRYPEAWQWVTAQLDNFSQANQDIAMMSDQLRVKVGARLIDFVDYLAVDDFGSLASQLEGYGYEYNDNDNVWKHPGAILPWVVIQARSNICAPVEVALKVDSIAQFLMVQGLDLPIEGSPYSGFRRCEVSTLNGISLWVVERRTSRGVEPVTENSDYLNIYFKTLEKWQTRSRGTEDSAATVEQMLDLAKKQVETAGADLAAYLFFEAERRFWQSRNRAAGIQKKNLDAVGMGWANHDHHTYRSSREHFQKLVEFFQILGFHPREKFYAGKEAGWGAQVVENPIINVTLFLDVDLSADELDIDFVQEGLPIRDTLGTVGLWCALHGDSLLQAGLHHLAVRSNFDRLTEILKNEQVKMMNPFSTFPYLKQAFTYGEPWPVKEKRVQRLLKDGFITAESAEQFIQKGALGSHMENIQRSSGYKGFSQKEVSAIIQETDPQQYSLD